jgi:hypothetical protein
MELIHVLCIQSKVNDSYMTALLYLEEATAVQCNANKRLYSNQIAFKLVQMKNAVRVQA